MKTVLIAGATGMLGSSIASHLLDQPDVTVRLLVRSTTQSTADKQALFGRLVDRGAEVVVGDVTEPASLDAAMRHVDVVVSALQGGADIIVDGQIALAEAAVGNGAHRFIPSDFAIDLFAAEAGAPQFDIRKQADEEIGAMPIEVAHVLNGGFMDMMLDPGSSAVVDLDTNTARLFGSGEERFNLTTVSDTARFTAMLAIDDADVAGIHYVSGAETSFSEIINKIEAAAGVTIERQTMGGVTDLRNMVAGADDPWSVVMPWYLLCMLTVPAFATLDNDRYPTIVWTGLDAVVEGAYSPIGARGLS